MVIVSRPDAGTNHPPSPLGLSVSSNRSQCVTQIGSGSDLEGRVAGPEKGVVDGVVGGWRVG